MLSKRNSSFLVFLFCFQIASAQENYIAIRAGKLFDGKSGDLKENILILIKGNKIVNVGEKIQIPQNTTMIDLSSMTVMPGLIDAHTHIVLHAGSYDGQIMHESNEYKAVYATLSARQTLESGITTIRDVGNEGAGLADVALRDAINKGIVPGPRILTAIQPITATGAYELTGYSPNVKTPPISYAADGVTEIRKQVRNLAKLGADLIKVYMESYEKKQTSKDSLTGAINYSVEEFKALTDEAHRAGLRVAAHTYSDSAARLAVEIGVNSIEHGLYIKESTFRSMAQKSIYYVPTLLVYELWRDEKLFGKLSEEDKIKLAYTCRKHAETFRRALATPVKIAFGTDTFQLHGTNAQELDLMVQYGMKPIDALRSATSVAAEVLGIGDETGTIEKSKSADIIAFAGDPLKDIRAVQAISFVMKEGNIFLEKK
jgi:imidazolonepropionase-like amidohydrolase